MQMFRRLQIPGLSCCAAHPCNEICPTDIFNLPDAVCALLSQQYNIHHMSLLIPDTAVHLLPKCWVQC